MPGHPKVLVVDDEDLLRTGMQRLLEMEGYAVDVAANGTEGVSLGTKGDYDLAIIDLKMPDKDGMEVLKEIHADKPNTVCFIATAFASFDTAIQATKLGADGYIPKPFSVEELLQQLQLGYKKRLLLLETERLRKDRENRLLEIAFERTRMNTIVNALEDGVLVVNKNGEAVLYNPSALKYLPLNEIFIEEFIIPKLNPQIAALINHYLLAEEYLPQSFSTQLALDETNETFIQITCSPVPHPDGTLAGVVTVLKNITELKKIEQLKSQFVSMVSHELKAPMAAVYGYLKLLSDDSITLTGEQRQKFIERSEFRLDSLLKMVNDLLDISRIEMKTVHREIIDLNLSEIIKTILELFSLEIKNRGLIVCFFFLENLSSIKADAEEINRLFTNLISNAIKYNQTNGRIDINISVTENFLVTTIADSGIGMKNEEKKKLFHEFFRAKNEFTKEISGTGLGLSIVKRIVDSYSGKIEVESEFGKGTKFIVSLPFRTSMKIEYFENEK
ncbi:MAG: response regulator [Ignavibacteriaceae bacterium]|nr:response regulator [Ignavibacteriaceae bacterium]